MDADAGAGLVQTAGTWLEVALERETVVREEVRLRGLQRQLFGLALQLKVRLECLVYLRELPYLVLRPSAEGRRSGVPPLPPGDAIGSCTPGFPLLGLWLWLHSGVSAGSAGGVVPPKFDKRESLAGPGLPMLYADATQFVDSAGRGDSAGSLLASVALSLLGNAPSYSAGLCHPAGPA